jgi:hypothetical protein
MPSRITTALEVDEPLRQDADYRFDDEDRAYLDDQIRGCQTHLTQSLLRGATATWSRVASTSAAVARGDCLCLAGWDEGLPRVTRALAPALDLAGIVFGVALVAAPPGAQVLAAINGAVPASVTGLGAANAAQAVECDPSTGRCRVVPKYLATSYPVGIADIFGTLRIAVMPRAPILGV